MCQALDKYNCEESQKWQSEMTPYFGDKKTDIYRRN